MDEKVQKALPVVLSITGSIGVVATSVLVAKETPKAMKDIEAAKKSGKKAVVMAFLKNYWPSLLAGAGTIASITIGTIIGKKTEMSLTAAVVGADQMYRRYKDKAKEIVGDKANDIIKGVSKDLYKGQKKDIEECRERMTDDARDECKLYWEDNIGFFYARPVNLAFAISDMNQRLQTVDTTTPIKSDHWTTLRALIYDADATIVGTCRNKPDKTSIDDMSFDYGWNSEYLNHMYGSDRVDVNYLDVYDDNGNELYTVLSFNQEPFIGADRVKRSNFACEGDSLYEYDYHLTGCEGTGDVFIPTNPRSQLREQNLNNGMAFESDIKERIKDE